MVLLLGSVSLQMQSHMVGRGLWRMGWVCLSPGAGMASPAATVPLLWTLVGFTTVTLGAAILAQHGPAPRRW